MDAWSRVDIMDSVALKKLEDDLNHEEKTYCYHCNKEVKEKYCCGVCYTCD